MRKNIIVLILAVNITAISFAQQNMRGEQVKTTTVRHHNNTERQKVAQSNQKVSPRNDKSFEPLSDELYAVVKNSKLNEKDQQAKFNKLYKGYSKWIESGKLQSDSLRLSCEQLDKNIIILEYRLSQKGKLTPKEQMQSNAWNKAVRDSLVMQKNAVQSNLYALQNKISHENIIISEDIGIFSSIKMFNNDDIPTCLKPHAKLIRKISTLNEELDNIENRIIEIKNWELTENEKRNIIITTIKSTINNTLSPLFAEINNMNLSSLSDAQQKYYINLKNRYNKLLSYF